jgi:hypothetical protein
VFLSIQVFHSSDIKSLCPGERREAAWWFELSSTDAGKV